MRSVALTGCCMSPPTRYGWWVCRVLGLLGWAERALCCILSLSSLLQGFLYDLDKVSGISALSPLPPPGRAPGMCSCQPLLASHRPAACPPLSPCAAERLRGGIGVLRAGGVWAGDEAEDRQVLGACFLLKKAAVGDC